MSIGRGNGRDQHAGSDKTGYDIEYFVNKFCISETEVKMALAEIHYNTPQELEDYLKVKYRK